MKHFTTIMFSAIVLIAMLAAPEPALAHSSRRLAGVSTAKSHSNKKKSAPKYLVNPIPATRADNFVSITFATGAKLAQSAGADTSSDTCVNDVTDGATGDCDGWGEGDTHRFWANVECPKGQVAIQVFCYGSPDYGSDATMTATLVSSGSFAGEGQCTYRFDGPGDSAYIDVSVTCAEFAFKFPPSEDDDVAGRKNPMMKSVEALRSKRG
jgi:hypothetical protein